MYVCMYVLHACMYVNVCMYACVYVCMSVCMCVCLCLCMYIYISLPTKGIYESGPKNVKEEASGCLCMCALGAVRSMCAREHALQKACPRRNATL